MLCWVVSTGTPGVELAALDAAKDLGIPTAGYYARGTVPPTHHPLREQPAASVHPYGWHFGMTDTTLLLHVGDMPAGLARLKKDGESRITHRVVVWRMADSLEAAAARGAALIPPDGTTHYLKTAKLMHVLGPSERASPGIAELVYPVLHHLFERLVLG